MCGRLAQTIQRLGFQLAHTLARHPNCLPNLFQCVYATIFQTIAQPQDLSFARWQTVERLLEMLLQHVRCDFYTGDPATAVTPCHPPSRVVVSSEDKFTLRFGLLVSEDQSIEYDQSLDLGHRIR